MLRPKRAVTLVQHERPVLDHSRTVHGANRAECGGRSRDFRRREADLLRGC
jgi:hypothetical protein